MTGKSNRIYLLEEADVASALLKLGIPTMVASLLSFPFRGFGTLPNKPFSTDAPQRGRGKIRKWVPASYACYECFYPLCPYPLLRGKSYFAKLPQKKNAAILKKDYNAF